MAKNTKGMMRVLHIVKTADGAGWAALQAQVLTRLGLEVHVALPSLIGEAVKLWKAADAHIHVLDCSLPIQSPELLGSRIRAIRQLVDQIQPDLIHSHFVTTTIMLRLALKRNHPIPRVFQVPGPLHLEHVLYRYAELMTADSLDYWIASSQYIRNLYLASGISASRVFLSYYGTQIKPHARTATHIIRSRFPPETHVVGNISYMYPPKWYLGQFKGLKRHEDVIDAVGMVCKKRPNVVGVLIGGEWGKGNKYERRLREYAHQVGGDRIILLGRVPYGQGINLWHEFDVAVHVPISENCGGVVEPLLAGVPTIASRVGGLPEVVIDGITGWLVPPKHPSRLADAILYVLDHPDLARDCALRGKQLVTRMFDVNRTGGEVARIYRTILGESQALFAMFDLAHIAGLNSHNQGAR